eukprot:COSAG05_NODE_47_length_24712_cov_26.673844_12_plen_51_part_00
MHGRQLDRCESSELSLGCILININCNVLSWLAASYLIRLILMAARILDGA